MTGIAGLTTAQIHGLANDLRAEVMRLPTGIAPTDAFDRIVLYLLDELPEALEEDGKSAS